MVKRVLSFNKIHLLAFCVFMAISVFSLRSIFANGDPVAFHDFAPIYRFDQLSRPYDFPWDYKSNLGTASVMTGNAVYNLPLIGLSFAFGSVAIANKVLLLLCMAVSGFGFYVAFAYLLKSKVAGFVAGLYMLFNPFTLTRWEFGHNTMLLAYAVLPFAVLCFFKVMKEGGKTSLFICGLLTALMIYASPQVAYLFVLFALFYAVFGIAFLRKTGIVKRIVARAIQVGLILTVALVAAFPFFFQLAMVNLPVYSTRAEEAVAVIFPTDISGVLIPQVALLLFSGSAFFFLWWKSGFKKLFTSWKNDLPLDSPSFLIKVSRQQILFFGLVGFIAVIIVSLVISPFTSIYYWLFNHIPGFGMFREVDKFFMLYAFSIAFFLGLAAEGFKLYLAKHSLNLRKILPLMLVSLIVLAASWPFLTGDIGGAVATVQIPDANQQLDNWLSSQNGDFRIAFFPPAVWATNYSWASKWFLDPVVALQAKPTVEIKGESDLTQGASLTRWVYSAFYSNRTSDWSKLLSILGVKYVIIRLDADIPPQTSDPSAISLTNLPPEMLNGHGLETFSRANTLAIWHDQPSLRIVKNFTSILVFENTNPLPKLSQSNGLSLIVGDRETLISLSNMNFNFTQNPSAFIDNNIGLTNSLLNASQNVFFQGDPYWSLLVASLGENYLIKPWVYAPVSTNPLDKWVSGDLIWNLYNGDLNVAPDGYIYTEGTNKITIPLSVPESGNYHVLVQVYNGLPKYQGVNLTIDNAANYILKPTSSTEGSYKWVELGNSNIGLHSELQISCLGGPAAVSKIALIPENTLNATAQSISMALQESHVKVVYLFDSREWNYNNAAIVMNPEANNGRLIDLSNSSIQTKFYVFNEGAYSLNLTFQKPTADVTVKVHIDNLVKNVTITNGADAFSEVEVEPITLSRGYHDITIEAETGDAKFNMAKLSSNESEAEMLTPVPENSSIPSYSMHSGSEYTVTPTAGYLAFLEAGNGYWKLYGPNGATDSINILNYGSLFRISDAGSQYTIKYVGVEYVQQGFLVAVAGTILLAVALKFLYPKRITRRTPAH